MKRKISAPLVLLILVCSLCSCIYPYHRGFYGGGYGGGYQHGPGYGPGPGNGPGAGPRPDGGGFYQH